MFTPVPVSARDVTSAETRILAPPDGRVRTIDRQLSMPSATTSEKKTCRVLGGPP
jgi:hypothetical protein